jgi:muramoyltetrapeptide carboxypeptidase LdcA involved in peptidoglycan recycling
MPVGHVDVEWTLPLGVRARLDADAGELELLDPAMS